MKSAIRSMNATDVEAGLVRYHLPDALKQRLIRDATAGGNLYSRIPSTEMLDMKPSNSTYCGARYACCVCKQSDLIQAGYVGKFQEDENYSFLAPGYHSYFQCGTTFSDHESVTQVNQAVVHGPLGFITITEGMVGVLMVGSDYRLLPPGTYQWSSPCVNFRGVFDITKNEVKLGPYTLITVPDGEVAVTFNNGELRVLGHNETRSRTYFLDDPKWVFRCFLPLREQTDRLEGNDLLSRDNVELLMVAMSQWRIVDPVLAVARCDPTMEGIRTKINALVRATIARIVAGTNIGNGPVSGGSAKPVVKARVINGQPKEVVKESQEEEPMLSHLMQSEHATHHMAELSSHVAAMGVEVVAVYVPEKRMKNDDIRQEVAKQAVIGIKAEADRSAADAKAYATITAARAEAQAIGELAKAHAEAGDRLGHPSSTAARLALTETTAKALGDARITVFSGAPSNIPFLFSGETMS